MKWLKVKNCFREIVCNINYLSFMDLSAIAGLKEELYLEYLSFCVAVLFFRTTS